MKILYYLEPYAEFGKPLFRMGTVRNHFEAEMAGLHSAQARDVEITLICSEAVAAAIRAEGRLPGVRLVTLAQTELERVYPDYLEASARFYNRDYSPEAMDRALALYGTKLAGYEPDVIVCYESNAPFLALLFPRALFLHNTLGIFSRAPFPETSTLDPFGVAKDSYLARCGRELSELQLTPVQQARLERLKHASQQAQVERSPVERSALRQGFERVALLPLQVSKYFMFDENLPMDLRGIDQLGLLEHVLEHSDPKVGIYVTMHGSEAKLLTPARSKELRSRFPNFLYDPKIQGIQWPSQHVLPHVDAVITVSSAVGLLALLWDLPTVVLGRSHLTGIAASGSLSDLSSLVSDRRIGLRDGALYHLLTTYYPQMDRFHHRGDWFRGFLADCHARKEQPCALGFFREIADPDLLFDSLCQGLQPTDGVRSDAERAPMKRGLPRSPFAKEPLRSKIQRADVVSFDVFDTLVTRPLSEPNVLFELIASQATNLFERHGVRLADFGGFLDLRKRAARISSDKALENGSEEYSLDRVYSWMASTVGVPDVVVPELQGLEEQAEIEIALPRESGKEAFELALALRKRVLLISDTYLDARVVADIVKRCGYSQYERLFVSSDFGKLKRTGNLYKHVRQIVGTEECWLHVGDNALSDVRVPERMGILTHHTPSATTLYARDALVRGALGRGGLGKSLGARIAHGVIARRFFDRSESQVREARFGGSAYRLGFEAGGPLFLGFCTWLLDEARRDGITDLYFLARDGLIPRQICDLLPGGSEGTPRTHYIWASRRSYMTAAFETPADVLDSLALLFRTATVRNFLLDRFGLDGSTLTPGSVSESGFVSLDEEISQQDPVAMTRLRNLVLRNMDAVLTEASHERRLLKRYLSEVGLSDPKRRIAVVDIGHNASLQVALARLSGRSDLMGYYFATFSAARAPYLAGHQIKSYLLEFEDTAVSEHPYVGNVGVFEFLFLPAVRSFVRFKETPEQTLEPVFAETDERLRFDVVREVHRGTLDFIKDAVRASLGSRAALEMSKNEATNSFIKYSTHPDLPDATLLAGVGFASGLGSHELRYLIAPAQFSGRKIKESWWKAGAEVVAGIRKNNLKESDEGTRWKRKLLKLQRDPGRFLADMRVVRLLRQLVD